MYDLGELCIHCKHFTLQKFYDPYNGTYEEHVCIGGTKTEDGGWVFDCPNTDILNKVNMED